MKKLKGFTLVEVMIVVAIIGILAAIAYPSYADYMKRGKIPIGLEALHNGKVFMERYFLDNKKYTGACTASQITGLSTDTFKVTCSTPKDGNFLLEAEGQSAKGMAGFKYTINELGEKKTTGVPNGWTSTTSNCWVLRKDGSC